MSYGRSKQTNQHTKQNLVYGIGQGTTNGPSGWTCISDIILKYYHKTCNDCKIEAPKREVSISANADMFVNDNTLMHNNVDKGVNPRH